MPTTDGNCCGLRKPWPTSASSRRPMVRRSKRPSVRLTRRRAIKLLSAISAARTVASANWMRLPLQPTWRPSTAAKTATERARQLEADIAAVKAKLAQPANTEVGAVNPLGTALANLIGSAADVLTSWQQAIVAPVFELCLVGVMVIYELLGHSKLPAQRTARTRKSSADFSVKGSPSKPIVPRSQPLRSLLLLGKGAVGSVSRFISENVATAQGARIEMRDLIRGYRDWCAAQGLKAIDLSKALDEVEALCRADWRHHRGSARSTVYCVGAILRSSSPCNRQHGAVVLGPVSTGD